VGGIGEESREEYELRDDAAELALIGLAITSRGVWDGEEVVVDWMSPRSRRRCRPRGRSGRSNERSSSSQTDLV